MEELEDLVLQELRVAKEPGQAALATSPLARELTQMTCMLSNLLLVNTPMAARVLDAAAEEMVVFRGDGPKPVRNPRRSSPFSLGTKYVRRYINERDAEDIKYERDGRKLYLPGCKSPTRTSVEADVTVPQEVWKDLLIPRKSDKFCWAYPCSELPRGGYLYLASNGDTSKPLSINTVSRTAGHHALVFGEPKFLNQEAADLIEDELHGLPEDDPCSLGRRHIRPLDSDCGVVKVAWVMKVHGVELNHNLGGFAYVFSDPAMNRIFPLEAVGEVLRMANLSWDVNAHALEMQPSGAEIERSIAPPGEYQAAPVAIMRITAPDVLHPLMLHALAFTPREDVLRTDVAKAISYAAFSRAWPMYMQQFIFDLVSALVLNYISWEVNDLTEKGEGYWSLEWRNAWAMTLIATALLKNVYDEVRKFIGYWKCKWMREYMSMNTFKNLGSMAAVAALLVLLALPNPPEDQGYLRTLLAAAGFFKWVKIVSHCRVIQTHRLGQKLLPIYYTLREGLSFLVVMMFFIMAACHAFYSLYPERGTSWTYLFSMTYNFGFLGSFDPDNLLSQSANDGTNSWAWVQHLTFAIAAMLVMVMLTNIYIGVMGNAYNHYHGKARELFVRARASICLDISLQYNNTWKAMFCDKNGSQLQDDESSLRDKKPMFRDEYLWFCRADSGYSDYDAEDDPFSSVPQMVRELKEAMETQARENRRMRELRKFQHVSELVVQRLSEKQCKRGA